VTADRGFLRVALAAVREPPPLAPLDELLDHPFDGALGGQREALCRRLGKQVRRLLLASSSSPNRLEASGSDSLDPLQ